MNKLLPPFNSQSETKYELVQLFDPKLSKHVAAAEPFLLKLLRVKLEIAKNFITNTIILISL